MKLEFIPLGKLSISKSNMRYARKAPDVSDILPTVRARGVIQPVLVRPNCEEGHYEIVAGSRRFHAAKIVAQEAHENCASGGDTGEPPDTALLPCAVLDEGDDADAVEASLIENIARLDPDEMTQWECFTRLVREGRKVEEIAVTFGLPDLAVKRVLALGNLLPRIRDLYRREEIDVATVRQLTLASKRQQREWLGLLDDPAAYAPRGFQLKGFLLCRARHNSHYADRVIMPSPHASREAHLARTANWLSIISSSHRPRRMYAKRIIVRLRALQHSQFTVPGRACR